MKVPKYLAGLDMKQRPSKKMVAAATLFAFVTTILIIGWRDPEDLEKVTQIIRGDTLYDEDPKLGWPHPVKITDRVLMNITSGSEVLGTLTVGLYGEIVPKSAQNFLDFARCPYGPKRCLTGDSFHRLVPKFVLQGGSSSTAKSFLTNETFREEKTQEHHSYLSHGRRGMLAWAEYPIGSQFYITLCCEDEGPRYLDGNHVVFGTLLGSESEETLQKMQNVATDGEKPKEKLAIQSAWVASHSLWNR